MWERVNDRYEPSAAYSRTHRTPQELARYENHVRYMVPLEPQLGWLRDAGFASLDVFWKRLDWVIYGGMKPLEAACGLFLGPGAGAFGPGYGDQEGGLLGGLDRLAEVL